MSVRVLTPFCIEGIGRKPIPLGHGFAAHSLVVPALLDRARFTVFSFKPLKVVALLFPILCLVSEDSSFHDLSP